MTEIKEMQKEIVKEQNEEMIGKSVEEMVYDPKAIKLYQRKMQESPFLEEKDEDGNDIPTQEYREWLINYKETMDNKIRKIKCSNCKCKVEYTYKFKPKACPHCNEVYFDKPVDEYQLFKLQDHYLIHRDKETLGRMYEILKVYAKKTAIKLVKGKFYFKVDDLEMKAHDATAKVITYYLTRPEFKIEQSFGGYLQWPVRHALWGDRQDEDHDSLNCLIDSENELSEYLPLLSDDVRRKTIIDFEDDYFSKNNNIAEELEKIISQISSKINRNFGKAQNLLFLNGMKNKCKLCSDNFMDSYYLFCGLDTQSHINKALFIVYKYIKQNYV